MDHDNLSDKWFAVALHIYREDNKVSGSGTYLNDVYQEIGKGFRAIEKQAQKKGTRRVHLDDEEIKKDVLSVLKTDNNDEDVLKAVIKAFETLDREWTV